MRELVSEIAGILVAAVTAHQYVTLFLAIAVEEAGIPLPIPGDLLIAYYGWRAAGDPIELAQVVLTCALASTAGTLAPYWLARHFGRRVAERASFWLDIDPRRVAQLFGWLEGHGFRAVLLLRLIPGLRVAVSLVAGTAGVPRAMFAAGVFVAAVIYWTGWVLLGAFIGPHVADVISPAYLRIIIVLIPAAVIVLLATRMLIAARRRTRNATSGGTRGGPA